MANAPRPLIVGNWKMNGLCEEGRALAHAVVERRKATPRPDADMVLCPPATLLGTVGAILEGSGIFLGAQDCHAEAKGAHTGDVSAPMLADLGCRFVILGHSERRQHHGETNAAVAAKVKAAHAAGLKAIVCIGESKAERNAGKTVEIVEAQLEESLPEMGVSPGNTVIAYEPLWAIGSGKTPSIEEIGTVHERTGALLKELFEPSEPFSILYGGSVTAANAAGILAIPAVNGALVGGASLDAATFCKIAESCG
ncbi:MAG: triose-phosphate isomerase [Alphaproteobacteria bacterium]